jgi:pyruvate/2-oxoglutarate dehydrogenase complex dihydrolipoamide acyltransferase (E2) component
MITQLPPQGPPEPDEKLPGETELAALYHQLPQSEPSPALDAAVLRAAAQALTPDEESPTVLRERRKAEREHGDWVHPKPVTSSPVASSSAGGGRRRPRWLIPLSSAATLVLAAGLVWHIRELPLATSTPTAMDSAAPAQATAAASLPRATPPAAAMQSAEPAPSPPMEPPKQPPPKMVAAPLRTPTANALRKAAADQSAERASSKAKVTGELRQYAPTPVAEPAAPPVALQDTSSNSAEAAPETPTTMAAASAPAAPPTDETAAPQAAGDSAASAARPTLDEAVTPVAPRVRARMPVAPTPFTAAANMDTTSYASDTPAQELDKIRQLFALGHDDEARQRLTAFHLAHPRWDLPLDLQAKLRKP